MIKDVLLSFRDNLKEKTTNPILGVYISVFIFRNWELFYSLFNFDGKLTLDQKITFIKNYIQSHDGVLSNLGTNLWWSFVILIFTYTIVNLSRLIINLFDKQLTPFIYKITDSKTIVLKSVYEAVRNERDNLQNRLDVERESKSKLETRIKKLEDEITELNNPQASIKTDINDIALVNNNESSKKVNLILEKFQDESLLSNFLQVSTKIIKGDAIPSNDKEIDVLIKLGLIEFLKDHQNHVWRYYKLSDLGNLVLDRVRYERNEK